MTAADHQSVATDTPGEAFEHYVRRYRRSLYRFAVVLCGDTTLGSDLVADVLGRAFERWSKVAAADDVHAYVRRMLVNEFISWSRRRARTAPHPDVGRLVDLSAPLHGSAPIDHGERYADRAALQFELTRLPARQRAAIVLRYFEDLDDDAIAATLGCRVGTVRSNISRGLATLRISMPDATGKESR